MNDAVKAYAESLSPDENAVCGILAAEIERGLPKAESKIWHRHPVWFLDGNPIVGFSKLKDGIRLMFWSGADFGEAALQPSKSGKFKDASITFTRADQINVKDLRRWLKRSQDIQWDYKNIIKRKGVLYPLNRRGMIR